MQIHLPYFPFGVDPSKASEPYKPAMGIKPLDLKTWIERGDSFVQQVDKKSGILKNHRDLVLKVAPEVGDAILETQDLLKDHLLENFPAHYRLEGNCFHVLDTGKKFELSTNPEQALENFSQWVQEDFCWMAPTSPVRLVSGCVCFPSRWNLPQKLKMNSDEIHAPVPKFQEAIGKPAATFLEKLQVEKPIWRLNWTIHDCDEIFTPVPDEGRSDLTLENILQHTFIRMERQTLRRLPKSNYVLFTIRTYIFAIRDIIQDSNKRIALKQTLETLPEETAHYKGMRKFFSLLKSAL